RSLLWIILKVYGPIPIDFTRRKLSYFGLYYEDGRSTFFNNDGDSGKFFF
ncbi:hypothetical protein MKW94_021865, partial [Papaver nudicaule]|nr:hypothetical protein [Papaver nudicaule]